MMISSFALLLLGLTAPAEAPASVRVYVGTYTGGPSGSQGIYKMDLDLATGKLSAPELAAETPNPSFLAIHPSKKYVYSVSEVGEFQGKKSGAVVAFAIDPSAGLLKELNAQPSMGAAPCHIVIDRTGKAALVANYSGGSVTALPIGQDGKLGEPSCSIQHQGSSVNKSRQESPHAHSINLDARNKFAVAADLGLDKLLVYKFDPEKAQLTPNEPPSTSVAAGSGPRHFAFHPDGKHAYVINEIKLTVTAFDYDADKGILKEIQTISTVPEDTNRSGLSTAEVQVHPSGKFVYGSNRRHDTLAIFEVDGSTGKLKAVGHQSTGGKTPRNFGIDPTGKYVLASNQDSDNVVVFLVDEATGKLKETGQSAKVPKSVCVKFLVPGD
jgi:6-phosphogluconolactonase